MNLTRKQMLGALGAAALSAYADTPMLPHSLVGGRQSLNRGTSSDAEDEMYKELFLQLLRKQLTEIDIDDEIDASTSNSATGARPFYGQSNLVKIRLRNLKTRNYGSLYLDGVVNLQELWLDNTEWLTNSIANLSKCTYIYMPSVTRIQNPITAGGPTAVFDFGGSRTCQEFLDSWSSLFEQQPNTRWTFRCSDGDVAYDSSTGTWKAVTA